MKSTSHVIILESAALATFYFEETSCIVTVLSKDILIMIFLDMEIFLYPGAKWDACPPGNQTAFCTILCSEITKTHL